MTVTLELPTERQARIAREAVRAVCTRARDHRGEPFALARFQIAQEALSRWLDVAEEEDLPAAVAGLMDHAQARIYYTRDDSPQNRAWRTLYAVIDAVLDPQPAPEKETP